VAQNQQHKSNRTFFIMFGIVVLVLHGIAFALILISRSVGAAQKPDEALVREQIVQRIAPMGTVATSQEQLAALMPAAAPSAATQLSGAEVVKQYCGSCHDAGVLGAPKSHDAAAWSARSSAAGGHAGLVASAIKGKGQMPPRGGVPELSDAQISEAVRLMAR